MTLLEYPVTRPVLLGRWSTRSVVVGWTLWVTAIILTNVIAVGYESVSMASTSYKEKPILWYQRFLPGGVAPQSRECEGSVIKQLEGKWF